MAIIPELWISVETQMQAPHTQYVSQTYERLRADGLSDRQAKEQISYCLADALDEVVSKKGRYDVQSIRKALDALPWIDEDECVYAHGHALGA